MKKTIILFLISASVLSAEINTRYDFSENDAEVETFIEKNSKIKECIEIFREKEENILKAESEAGIKNFSEIELKEEINNLSKKYDADLKNFNSLDFKTIEDSEQEKQLLNYEKRKCVELYERLDIISKNINQEDKNFLKKINYEKSFFISKIKTVSEEIKNIETTEKQDDYNLFENLNDKELYEYHQNIIEKSTRQ